MYDTEAMNHFKEVVMHAEAIRNLQVKKTQKLKLSHKRNLLFFYFE